MYQVSQKNCPFIISYRGYPSHKWTFFLDTLYLSYIMYKFKRQKSKDWNNLFIFKFLGIKELLVNISADNWPGSDILWLGPIPLGKDGTFLGCDKSPNQVFHICSLLVCRLLLLKHNVIIFSHELCKLLSVGSHCDLRSFFDYYC